MKGKHCEILNMGDATAIACGVPDRCDHDSDGEWYYLVTDKRSRDSEWYKSSEIPSGQKELEEWLQCRHAVIGTSSSSCSKCGALAIDYCDMNLI
jgi:hypothetical protein